MKAPTEPIVAVVHLDTQPPLVLQQVTLRPDKVKDGHIRLGETMGDEALCWIALDRVHVVMVLGRAVQVGDKWECHPFELKQVA